MNSKVKGSKKFSNKNQNEPQREINLKLWLILGALILFFSVYLARSPLFALNVDKPLKANYIE